MFLFGNAFLFSGNNLISKQNTLRLRKCCGNIRSCRKGFKGKEELRDVHEQNVPGAVSTRQGRPRDPTM